MLLCDFHIHTQYSDGQLSLPDVIDLYGQAGFDVISITDHLCDKYTLLGCAAQLLDKTILYSNFQRYLDDLDREAQRAMRQYGLLVIPGVEFTKNSFVHSKSAHILGLGVIDFIDPILPIEEICSQLSSMGALSVAAHPVPTRKKEHQTYMLWERRNYFEEHIDLWEVSSGAVFFGEVFDSGLPMVANSDFHSRHHFHSWKTVLNCEKNKESVLKALKEQQLDFIFYRGEETCLTDQQFQKVPNYYLSKPQRWESSLSII